MRRPRRELQVFSLSMMDVITNGFGTMVLLLMIQSLKTTEAQASKTELVKLRTQVGAMESRIRSSLRAAEEAVRNAAEAQAREAQARLEAERARMRTEFVGVKSNKRRWLLVVDLSGSMKETPKELEAAVGAFVDLVPSDGAFGLMGFQGDSPNATLTPWRAPRTLYAADKGTREAAKGFLKELIAKIENGTPTKDALEEALKYPGVEAIVLFTDGAPNGCPEDDTEPTLQCLKGMADGITALNQAGPNAEIHCIGIGRTLYKSPNFAKFLAYLKDKNHGGYAGLGL